MLKVLSKSTQGYNYKYTELSEIVKEMAEQGLDYYQYTETDPNTLKDYMYTVLIKDGKESKPLRGTEIVMATLQGKSNPAQEMGSSITYARRYSLLMALGWATEDDDAKGMDGAKKREPQKPMETLKPTNKEQMITPEQTNKIVTLIEELGYTRTETLKHIEKTGADDIVKLTKTQADKYIAFLEKQKSKKSVENVIIENAKENSENEK